MIKSLHSQLSRRDDLKKKGVKASLSTGQNIRGNLAWNRLVESIKVWNLPTGTAEHLLLFFITTAPWENRNTSVFEGRCGRHSLHARCFHWTQTPGDYRAGRKTNRSRRNGRIQGQKHRSVQRPSQLFQLETHTHTHTSVYKSGWLLIFFHKNA